MSFEEQIISKDKYASMFLCKIEAVVFIILQIFCNVCKKKRSTSMGSFSFKESPQLTSTTKYLALQKSTYTSTGPKGQKLDNIIL